MGDGGGADGHPGRRRRRGGLYLLLLATLAMGAVAAPRLDWSGGPWLHTVMEAVSAVLALVAGTLTLVRFHTAPRIRHLFLGAGFLAAGILDAYHAVVTAEPFVTHFPGASGGLVAWSWLASRLALAVLLAVGVVVGSEERVGAAGWKRLAHRVYLLGALVTVGSFALFALAPLPDAAYLTLPLARPQELLPGALFAFSLVAHLREGRWSWDPLKHGLVLSLILATVVQVAYMPFSRALHDASFEASHLLKLASYLVLLGGVAASLVEVFGRERRHLAALERQRAELEGYRDRLEVLVADRTEELRRSEARFRRLYDADMLGVLFWDIRGAIREANDRFLRITGYERGDLEAGRIDWVRMTPPEHAGADRRALGELEARGSCTPFEKEYLRKDGSRVPVLLGAALLEGSQDAGVAFVLDISERVEARRELERVNRELEDRVRSRTSELRAINQELEAFAYTVSHDLRAPCRQVDGFSRILLSEHGEELSAGGRRYLELLRASSVRMGTLVDELLEYSRLGRSSLEPRPVEPGELVAELVAELEQGDAGSGAVRFEVGELPLCVGDRVLLRQLWANLLENAVKFSAGAEEPRVQVGAELREGRTVYRVADNGVGFDMRHADKLFGVFQRLHSAAEFPGSGVGLATVQRIVHRHGGEVWAEARPGEGATFFFTLDGAQTS